jgi:hypothetical protein
LLLVALTVPHLLLPRFAGPLEGSPGVATLSNLELAGQIQMAMAAAQAAGLDTTLALATAVAVARQVMRVMAVTVVAVKPSQQDRVAVVVAVL